MTREHFATIVIDTEETPQGLQYHARFVTKAIPVVEASSLRLFNAVDTVTLDANNNLAKEMVRRTQGSPCSEHQANFAACETGRFGR